MGKTETDSLKKIDIRFLKKEGYFDTWTSGRIFWTSSWSGNQSSVWVDMCLEGSYLSLSYGMETSSGKKDFNYQIPLTTTPCFFGGIRYWFLCPLSQNGIPCRRRVGVLYLGGSYFGCRHCYNLCYSSQNQNRSSSILGLFKILELGEKLDTIMASMKRWSYAGKPTKKLMKLKHMQEKFSQYSYSALGEKGV